MKNISKVILSVVCCLYCITAHAQTVRWQEKPLWDTIEMLNNQLLRVEQSGKWGVIGIDGSQIVPCDNSIITDICEGRFLVLNEKGKIISLRSEEGNSFPIERDWFVDINFPYFSNNRLAVHDSQGRWGFLNKSGKVAIEPNNDFICAFPFFYDLSAVQYNDKEKSWGYIYLDGSPLKYENSKISNGYKDIKFASSYTNIEGTPAALVRLKETLYMIDQYGNIMDQVLPKKGLPINILKLTPDIPVSSGDISFVFNTFGEITSLKKNNKEYIKSPFKKTNSFVFPLVDNITIDKEQRINIGELTISPQFQEIVPLSSSHLLVKKEGKWGLLNVDRNQDAVKIDEKPINRRKNNKSIEFTIINGNDKTKAFYIDALGERKYLDIAESKISVPITLIGKDKKIIVGLEIDNVLLEPTMLSANVPSQNDSKGTISIKTKTEKINDGSAAVFSLETTRDDYKSLIVEINGISQKWGNSKLVTHRSSAISFRGRKEVSISVKVKDSSGKIVKRRNVSIYCKN